MDFSSYILRNRKKDRVTPPIHLKGGLVVSIQASEWHYCTPKNKEGPYVSFEVMLMEDNSKFKGREILGDQDMGDPYGWVTQSRLDKFIKANGGIDEVKMVAQRLGGKDEKK